jgi:hypothetical protein
VTVSVSNEHKTVRAYPRSACFNSRTTQRIFIRAFYQTMKQRSDEAISSTYKTTYSTVLRYVTVVTTSHPEHKTEKKAKHQGCTTGIATRGPHAACPCVLCGQCTIFITLYQPK